MNDDPVPEGTTRRRLPTAQPGGSHAPPMFNLPPGVKALILLLTAIHLSQHLMPDRLDIKIVNALGFLPDRYWLMLNGVWAGPLYEAVMTPVTYMFLHANWVHLTINMMSLAAFGTVVERVAGARFMLGLFLLCGVIGAFTEFALAPNTHEIIIGASAGISGLFAVAFMTLARQQKMSRRKLVLVISIMLLIMSVTGVAGVPGGMPVAWVAHVGGFLSGMVADASITRRDGANPLHDLGWFAAMMALPLFILVTNISHYFQQ